MRELGLVCVMLVVWAWEWRVCVVYGVCREGRTVVVSAAWEGHERRIFAIAEMWVGKVWVWSFCEGACEREEEQGMLCACAMSGG